MYIAQINETGGRNLMEKSKISLLEKGGGFYIVDSSDSENDQL